MPAKKTTTPSSDVLDSLLAIPAPLRSEQEGKLFWEAAAKLQDAAAARLPRAFALSASKELIRVVTATVDSKLGRKLDDDILFALKQLAYLGTKEGVACIANIAKRGYAADHYLWSVVLNPFGRGHPGAAMLFRKLSKPLPEKFLAISLLDAANSAANFHKLGKHPFSSAEGVKKLNGYLSGSRTSYAVSACAAIPFIAKARRKPLIETARKHKDPSIRMEIAWATAKLGDKSGTDYLVKQCLDRNDSAQARRYLEELGKKKLVPKAARNPDFEALAEMCEWLTHPNEFGKPPDTIELIDKRTIYWPPTRDVRELWLFSYGYKKTRENAAHKGVGMVGSVTWSFFDDTKPTMKPEDIYGHHCCFELEINEDPRAPKKRTAKAGWAMVKARK